MSTWDPTHQTTSPKSAWTTVNAGEALPGVATPLTWTFYSQAVEIAIRQAWADLGVLSRAEVRPPATPDDRFAGMFFGRMVTSLDNIRAMADRIPGMSGNALEEQLFGTVRPSVESRRSARRYPFIVAKAPVAAWRSVRRLKAQRATSLDWWRRCLTSERLADPRSLLTEANARFQATIDHQFVVSMMAQAGYDRIARAATAAGMAGLELKLLAGLGSYEETQMMSDLWDVSRGRLALDAFLGTYGYHGPAAGELSSHSWREDPASVEELAATYSGLDDAAHPRRREDRQAGEREEAERRLLSALDRRAAMQTTVALKLTRAYMPLREVGRAAFLPTFDVARAAARRLGAEQVDLGVLDDPDDIFFLTIDEVAAPLIGDVRATVAARRENREGYRRITLPEFFVGEPEPIPIEIASDADSAKLEGIGVSAGVVEGVARVVVDLSGDDPLLPGEILVCEATDPTWAALFTIASGIVLDIGGTLSHGAIVARELGIPCVVNTKDGTRRLRSGWRLRVDGTAGTVEVLSTDPSPNPIATKAAR